MGMSADPVGAFYTLGKRGFKPGALKKREIITRWGSAATVKCSHGAA